MRTIFHGFWSGQFKQKQQISLKSALATQQGEIWLWLDEKDGWEERLSNPFVTEISGKIVLKKYSISTEVIGTPLEHNIHLYTTDKVSTSDVFRFLILYHYGGVYFDLDVLFLKDFSPLLTEQFAYPWDENNQKLVSENKAAALNQAILHIYAKGDLALSILHALNISLNNGNKYFNGYTGFAPFVTTTKHPDLHVLPMKFFDPCWVNNFRPKYFFEDSHDHSCYSDIPAAYAFHWHNCWDLPIDPNSKFAQLSNQYTQPMLPPPASITPFKMIAIIVGVIILIAFIVLFILCFTYNKKYNLAKYR